REKSYDPRVLIPPTEWQFAKCEQDPPTGKKTITPSTEDLYLPSGFKPGHIYEFIYLAKDPLVLGLGFAAVRDLVSFLRYEVKDAAGHPNPLAKTKEPMSSDRSRRAGHPLYLPPRRGENKRGGNINTIRYAYGWGRSQSGRFLRDFVYHGFNED